MISPNEGFWLDCKSVSYLDCGHIVDGVTSLCRENECYFDWNWIMSIGLFISLGAWINQEVAYEFWCVREE